MNTAKHTPGPLHTRKPSLGQPCTCCILLRTGEPLESIHGDRTCSDISRIELCPLHAAAPAMYEALKAIQEKISGADVLFDPNPQWEGDQARYDAAQEALFSVDQALAQAEGK